MEPRKKAFPKNVQEDGFQEGVHGLEERSNHIALPATSSLGETLHEMVVNFIRSVAGETAVVIAGSLSVLAIPSE
jgi:hypothetical protein